MTSSGNTIYELDAENRIYHIEGEWDEFLSSNSSTEQTHNSLCMQEVLGTRIESHIHDDMTRMLIKTVIASVRQSKQEKSISYRCDSPDLKRFMKMLIEPLMRDAVRLSHAFLRAEPLDPPVYIRPASKRATKVNARCSICNRIEVDRTWLEPDEACQASGESSFEVSYKVCPVCLNTA
jgi:hypothetical protein